LVSYFFNLTVANKEFIEIKEEFILENLENIFLTDVGKALNSLKVVIKLFGVIDFY
jgi:hypothetical protein